MLWAGCTGGTETSGAPTSGVVTSVVPADLVSASWQVRMASDQARAAFEGRDSWVGYFQGKRREVLPLFLSENDPVAAARVHLEYASMYRQAARIAALSTTEVYGADRQDTDPLEVRYLVGVSGALLGDARWRPQLGNSSGSLVPGLAAADVAWKAWLDAGATWPPDVPASTSAGASSAVLTPGALPDAGTLPHYRLPEIGVDTKVNAGDPGTLWALSRQHEAAARALAADQGAAWDAMLDPWRLPPETVIGGGPGSVPDALLFMSFYTSAADLSFGAAVARDGLAAVEAAKDKSAYATVIASCITDNKLSTDCVLDQAAALDRLIEDTMNTTRGQEDSLHRSFAEYARVGLIRVADRVALAMGDVDTYGRLRINALDRTIGNTRDPLFLLFVTAWDAGNRNSVRAEDLLHGLISELPGGEAARLPLDALHIRLSRNAAPARPMH